MEPLAFFHQPFFRSISSTLCIPSPSLFFLPLSLSFAPFSVSACLFLAPCVCACVCQSIAYLLLIVLSIHPLLLDTTMTASNDHDMETKEHAVECSQDQVIPSYKVHRCRFINYAPNSINVTALSPLGTFPYLAVGRSNGDIELWNILNDWQLERKIPGGSASSIEALVWSSYSVFDDDENENQGDSESDSENECKGNTRPRAALLAEKPLVIDPLDKVPTPAFESIRHAYGAQMAADQPGPAPSKHALPKAMARLFSAGLSGQITEWDLVALKPKSVSDSYGGPVWAMSLSNDQRILAASCEDGSIRLFNITHSSLEYFKTFDRQPGRILSLAWHPTDRTLVSGSSEGIIRVWDVATGRTMQRITVESFQEQPTFVWSVLCLANGTIVSGDSLGHVQFWDAATFTLSQTFTSHEADVLALAASTVSCHSACLLFFLSLPFHHHHHHPSSLTASPHHCITIRMATRSMRPVSISKSVNSSAQARQRQRNGSQQDIDEPIPTTFDPSLCLTFPSIRPSSRAAWTPTCSSTTRETLQSVGSVASPPFPSAPLSSSQSQCISSWSISITPSSSGPLVKWASGRSTRARI